MARRIVILLLALALTGCGITSEPLRRAADTPPNQIIDQVVVWLHAQGNEAPSPTDIVGALNRATTASYQDGDYASAQAVAEVALNYAEHPDTLTSVSSHTPEFWLRVRRALPDYEPKKTWLAEKGMSFTL